MTYWLQHIAEPSIRRTTYATYEGDVRSHIVPGIGKRKLKALQATHIRAWLNQLRTTCQCCAQGKDSGRQNPRCLRDGQTAVLSGRSLLQLYPAYPKGLTGGVAGRRRRRATQPKCRATRAIAVTDDRKVRSFTRAEALRFLETAEKHRLYALLAVALAMGLRRGEALGLAWADVDLAQGRLTIRQALHRVNGELRLDPVKTDASIAVLPIPAPLVAILSGHRQRQLEERLSAGSQWRETGLVFTTAHGGFIEPRNANRVFHSLCERRTCLSSTCTIYIIRVPPFFTMGVTPATVQEDSSP
jgi:integrase